MLLFWTIYSSKNPSKIMYHSFHKNTIVSTNNIVSICFRTKHSGLKMAFHADLRPFITSELKNNWSWIIAEHLLWHNFHETPFSSLRGTSANIWHPFKIVHGILTPTGCIFRPWLCCRKTAPWILWPFQKNPERFPELWQQKKRAKVAANVSL